MPGTLLPHLAQKSAPPGSCEPQKVQNMWLSPVPTLCSRRPPVSSVSALVAVELLPPHTPTWKLYTYTFFTYTFKKLENFVHIPTENKKGSKAKRVQSQEAKIAEIPM